MPALLAAAVYFAAFSPAAVLFLTVVSQRPERIILMFLSAFAWLVSISLSASLWAALAPLKLATPWLLLHATLFQEAGRYAMYFAYVRLLHWLRDAGLQPRGAGPISEMLPGAAVASGVGVWVVHTLVLYGDVLWRSALPGSLYTPMCTHLSTFAVDAICACGMGSVNVLLSLVGWTMAYPRGNALLVAGMVALHLLASAATSLNSAQGLPVDGCTAAFPALAAVVVLSGCLVACGIERSLKSERGLTGGSDVARSEVVVEVEPRRRRLNTRSRAAPGS